MSAFTITLGTAAGYPQPQSITRTVVGDNVVPALAAAKAAATAAHPAIPDSVWRIKSIDTDLAAETPVAPAPVATPVPSTP